MRSPPTALSAVRAPLQVAAALIEDPQGRVLLAQRPAGKAQAGLWEFPGGKLEASEDAPAALCRELDEELGIRIDKALLSHLHRVRWRPARGPWIDLDGWHLRLDRQQSASAQPREHAALAWAEPARLIDYPMPEADRPLRARLVLPTAYAITPEPAAAERLAPWIDQQLQALRLHAPGLISLRARRLAASTRRRWAQAWLQQIRGAWPQAILLLHGDPWSAARLGFDGAHLSARRLHALRKRPGPAGAWLLASCHDASELQAAATLGADAAVLGPVAATRTHPNAHPLGWPGFASLIQTHDLPVYALGGMHPDHLDQARQHGAHGIAGIGCFFGA